MYKILRNWIDENKYEYNLVISTTKLLESVNGDLKQITDYDTRRDVYNLIHTGDFSQINRTIDLVSCYISVMLLLSLYTTLFMASFPNMWLLFPITLGYIMLNVFILPLTYYRTKAYVKMQKTFKKINNK